MASSSAKKRPNDRDKKGGLETKMEEQALQIETETMEKWRQSHKEQPHFAKGKRGRQWYKVEEKRIEEKCFMEINFSCGGISSLAN